MGGFIGGFEGSFGGFEEDLMGVGRIWGVEGVLGYWGGLRKIFLGWGGLWGGGEDSGGS